MKPKETQGFTLIELAIVIVIIGLIVGAILVGEDLIRASKIRKVLTEIESFDTAAITFRLKYNCMAGDCANATSFMPLDPACPTRNSGAGSGYLVTRQTCNGSGDGDIDYLGYGENYLFWQHLDITNLVGGGPYSGNYCNWYIQDCGEGPNKDVYQSSSGLGSISIRGFIYNNPPNFDFVNTSQITIGDAVGTHFILGQDRDGNASFRGTISPTEALSTDQKIDDAKPGYGKMRTFRSDVPDGYNGPHVTPGCTTTDIATTALYNATNTNKVCTLIVKAKF